MSSNAGKPEASLSLRRENLRRTKYQEWVKKTEFLKIAGNKRFKNSGNKAKS